MAIRQAATLYDSLADYKPVRQDAMSKYCQPLHPDTVVARIFENHPFNGYQWGTKVQELTAGSYSRQVATLVPGS
jgi:hypothetical protein